MIFNNSTLYVRDLLPDGSRMIHSNLHTKRSRRKDREDDFVSLLYCLSSAIRVGRDPLQALNILREQFRGTSMEEPLQRLQDSIQEGSSEEEAIRIFGNAIKCADSELFVVAYILSRQQGAPLGPFLKRLAHVMRQRQSLRRKKRSALAMQRLSALAMGACALLIVGMQCTLQTESLQQAWSDDLGKLLLLASGSCVLIGLGWMWYFTRETT